MIGGGAWIGGVCYLWSLSAVLAHSWQLLGQIQRYWQHWLCTRSQAEGWWCCTGEFQWCPDQGSNSGSTWASLHLDGPGTLLMRVGAENPRSGARRLGQIRRWERVCLALQTNQTHQWMYTCEQHQLTNMPMYWQYFPRVPDLGLVCLLIYLSFSTLA